MLELGSDNNETKSEWVADISFEMPAHEMCTERQAFLHPADGKSMWLSFGVWIDFMPDKIHVDGRRFVYEGVSDGRGFYREKPRENNLKEIAGHICRTDNASNAEVQPIVGFSPKSGSVAESIEFETNYLYPSEANMSTFDRVGFCDRREIPVCYHGIPHRDPCEDCEREESNCADGSDMIGDDTPVEELKAEWAGQESPKCLCPFSPVSGGHFPNCPAFEPKSLEELFSMPDVILSDGSQAYSRDLGCGVDTEYFTDQVLTSNCVDSSSEAQDLLVHCYYPESACTCWRTGLRDTCPAAIHSPETERYWSQDEIESAPDDGCGLQADSHTTASPCDNMQCPRCSEVLETVRQMAENPPGFSGIMVNKERYGNKYIDWGWTEACNRVMQLLGQGDSGTREKI